MLPFADFLITGRVEAERFGRRYGAGVAVSFVLHGLLALLLLGVVTRHLANPSLPQSHPFVPIDLVRLGEDTRSPPAETKALVPQQKAGRPHEAASPVDRAVSPTGKAPQKVDELEAKLKALARLKQPNVPLHVDAGTGVSNIDAANGAPGDVATYSLRDYVLAQVLRRWTLDLSRAGSRPLVVPLRVTMKRDGTITVAEIVEQARAKTDSLYRDIAIGARNAVLLSSPIVLPAGDYPKEMHFTLMMDTRAVLR